VNRDRRLQAVRQAGEGGFRRRAVSLGNRVQLTFAVRCESKASTDVLFG
jgi:hypothetical protein